MKRKQVVADDKVVGFSKLEEKGKPYVPSATHAGGVQKQEAARSRAWPTGRLLLCLVLYRVGSAFVVTSWFVPDEYWQSLEVAHRVVYGYGHLTWEWRQGVRGCLYPGVFALVYKLLALAHLDRRLVLIYAPKILQAAFGAVGDLHLAMLVRRLFGRDVARWALAAQLASWFLFYTVPRTMTNTAEMVLTTIALAHYPWPAEYVHHETAAERHKMAAGRRETAAGRRETTAGRHEMPAERGKIAAERREMAAERHGAAVSKDEGSESLYLIVAAVSCVVRPTSAITWLPLCSWHLYRRRRRARAFISLLLAVGVTASVVSILLDRAFYGEWVFVHLNFLRFNFLTDQSSFYGSHPWHWYFTQGIAAVAPSHVIPALLGIGKATNRIPAYLVVWSMAVLSTKPHKEFRFLLPMLPLLMPYVGLALQSLSATASSAARGRVAQRVLLGYLVVTNLPLALYASLVHQRGTVSVMHRLADMSAAGGADPMSVLFLMPCHSTPLYSHLHVNVTARFLTCEPNFGGGADYVDEADDFYRDPLRWLRLHVRSHGDGDSERSLPTHLVMFDALYPKIEEWTAAFAFGECARLFHTHFPDGRVGSEVVVYCRSG